MKQEQQELDRPLVQYLQSLHRSGILDLPRRSASPQSDAPIATDSVADHSTESELPDEVHDSKGDYGVAKQTGKTTNTLLRNSSLFDDDQAAASADYGQSLEFDQRTEALQKLSQQVAGCTACNELVANRTQTVFGVGSAEPRLCFLGEGPGADEDRQGEPFVGRAGQLLNKIIEACQMRREDVYILNTVKCRPPNNRNPADDELKNCWNYAQQQLEILQPEFIVCLGAIAAKTLLNSNEAVGKMRGRFHQYRGSRVVVTYHPAYLLRNPAAKAKTWDDMKMLLDAMGISRE